MGRIQSMSQLDHSHLLLGPANKKEGCTSKD
jgi:hypothetical protein